MAASSSQDPIDVAKWGRDDELDWGETFIVISDNQRTKGTDIEINFIEIVIPQ